MANVFVAAISPTPRFGLRTSRSRDRFSIRVDGELLETWAHHLEETLVSLAVPHDDIQIDLTGVTRIDKEGLEALLRAMSHAESLEARIMLRGLPSRFQRLLEMCDSESVFRFIEDDGVASSSSGRGTKWSM